MEAMDSEQRDVLHVFQLELGDSRCVYGILERNADDAGALYQSTSGRIASDVVYANSCAFRSAQSSEGRLRANGGASPLVFAGAPDFGRENRFRRTSLCSGKFGFRYQGVTKAFLNLHVDDGILARDSDDPVY